MDNKEYSIGVEKEIKFIYNGKNRDNVFTTTTIMESLESAFLWYF